MTTRSGWTIAGKHFTETITARMGAPRTMHFIDGKPVSLAVFHAEMHKAKAADAARAAVQAKYRALRRAGLDHAGAGAAAYPLGAGLTQGEIAAAIAAAQAEGA